MKSNGAKKTKEVISPALKQEFRNLGALIEDNNHKLRAVAEQFGDVKKALDSHTEMIGGLMTDVTSLKQDMGVVKGRLDVMQSDVEIIKNNLKRKVDTEDFEAVTHRVSNLERRVLK